MKCIQGVTSPEHVVLMVLQCICSFTQAFFSRCTPPSNLHHQHLMAHLFCSFHRCCLCPAEVGRDWDIKLLLQERRLNCKPQGNLSAGSGRRRSAVTVPEGKVKALIDKLWWILWQKCRMLLPGTAALSLLDWQKRVNACTSASLLQNYS